MEKVDASRIRQNLKSRRDIFFKLAPGKIIIVMAIIKIIKKLFRSPQAVEDTIKGMI